VESVANSCSCLLVFLWDSCSCVPKLGGMARCSRN
jgi:hypothetical protein